MARHWAARLKCIFEKKSPPHPPLSNKPADIYEVVFFSKKPWHPKASPLERVAFFFLFFVLFFSCFLLGLWVMREAQLDVCCFYWIKELKSKMQNQKFNKTLVSQGCCKAKNIRYVKEFLTNSEAYIFRHTIEYHKYYKVSAFYSIVIYTDSEHIKNAFDTLIRKLIAI